MRCIMNWLNKWERKLGKFAIPNLSLWIVITYAIGYVMMFTKATRMLLSYMTLEPYYIFKGQIWRLVTWIFIPPTNTSIFWYVLLLLVFYSFGTSLEKTWGTFRYNVYIFGGLLFTAIGAFVIYGIYYAMGYPAAMIQGIGGHVTTYYIYMTIFLALAVCYPDMQLLVWFIIPVRMKWMAYLYVGFMALEFIQTNVPGRVSMVASLLNFIIFYLSTRNYKRVSPKEVHRRREFHRQTERPQGYKNASGVVTKHKCAVCGRTELDDPTLEFRFCSKCDGNYEYCQEHLFTHQHVQRH